MLSFATKTPFRCLTPVRPLLRNVLCSRSRLPATGSDKVESIETSPDLKVVKVEEAGKEAWSGVAQLDVQKTEPVGSTTVLVFGDAAAFILFSIIGRVSHGEAIFSLDTISTATPFLIGWYTSAVLLDGYGVEAKSGRALSAASCASKCWLLSTPLGLGIRGLVKGYVPPITFAAITSVVTFVTLVGWRSAYAFIIPTSEIAATSAKTKKGTPLEFFSFLSSIVRRW
eukprot:g8808.t1